LPRKGWTTVSIPTELYERLAEHVPGRAASVPDYVRFWAKVGDLVDRGRNGDVKRIAERLRGVEPPEEGAGD